MNSLSTIVVDYVRPGSCLERGKRKAPMSSYTLALLLAQTPKEIDGRPVLARVHDEQVGGLYDPTAARPDILCLTYLTTGAYRAYEISDLAMRSTSHTGAPIKVVHGGIHATTLPREALLHANVAVRGEVTPEFQARLLGKALGMAPDEKTALRLASHPDVLSRPPADWSWMRRKDYLLAPTVQTSVGCPFHCDFCSVTEVFGPGMRAVDRNTLESELAGLPRKALLAIVDDNFLQGIQPLHTDHCLESTALFKQMGFKWVAELTARTLIEARKKLAAERPGFDLIEYFADHGCRGLYFGIETVSEGHAGLKKARSNQETIEMLRACQANGIGVLGAFVLGVGPDETPEDADRLLEFAIEDARLDFAQFSINTPMPGARNFITGVRDGTIFNFDWELYDAEHCVMRHPRMSPELLEETHGRLYREFYAYRSTFKRFGHLALLSMNPNLWKRLAVGLSANLYLHKTEKKWNKRLVRADAREIVAAPDLVVLEHVREALAESPERPGDLFNLRRADGFSVAYAG